MSCTKYRKKRGQRGATSKSITRGTLAKIDKIRANNSMGNKAISIILIIMTNMASTSNKTSINNNSTAKSISIRTILTITMINYLKIFSRRPKRI